MQGYASYPPGGRYIFPSVSLPSAALPFAFKPAVFQIVTCLFHCLGHRSDMRKILLPLFSILICAPPAFAQVGGGGQNSGMDELFRANPIFSATMQTVINGPQGVMNVTSKMTYDHGNSRSEMNMANVSGPNLPPNAAAQMKALGMDVVVTISTTAKTNIVTVYPNLKAYISTTLPPSAVSTAKPDVQVTKLGNDTVAGHPCVKNKIIVTEDGQPHEFTAWNATDLNNFPVQIAIAEQGMSATMTYQNVSFGSVSASEFHAPAGYKSYNSIPELMQAAMASRSGGAGAPPKQ